MNENKILKINSKTLEEIYYLLNKTANELIDIGEQDRTKNIIIIAEIALNPNTPTDVLKYLSNHEFDVIRGCVALNPNTPREILNKPFTIGEYSKEYKVMEIDTLGRIAREVARNLKTPKELLEKLAQDPLEYVRQAAATNPNTPINSLEQLVKEFPYQVASNPSTPPYLLEELAKTNPYQVAISPNTPGYLLEQLAEEFPYQVASNPNTPAHVLRALPNTFYDVVAENPNTPIDFLEELANKYPYEVASNPSTPPDLLEKLSNECPYQVASNPNAPKDLLEKWINHPSYNVRINIAKNPKASGELLKKLYESRKEHKLYNFIKEEEEQLLTELARNPNTPGEVLSKILKEILYLNKEEYEIEKKFITKKILEITINDEQFTATELVEFSNNTKEQELIYKISKPTTPMVELKIKAKSERELVRIAVAMNTKTPRETLEELKNDDSELVRMAAIKTLNDLPAEKNQPKKKERVRKKNTYIDNPN